MGFAYRWDVSRNETHVNHRCQSPLPRAPLPPIVAWNGLQGQRFTPRHPSIALITAKRWRLGLSLTVGKSCTPTSFCSTEGPS
jgi:hypothetical protein